MSCPSRWPLALFALGLAALMPSCGGGGGGGTAVVDTSGSGGTAPVLTIDDLDPKKHFFLVGAAFARPITTVSGDLDAGQPLVNPASLFETDPLTGVVLPGFPKVLVPGTSLTALATFSFDQILDPITPQVPLVPRNAALVLEFSQAPDLVSLRLDDSDPDFLGVTTATSTVQVVKKGGTKEGARIVVDPTNPKRLIVLGSANGAASWSASPLIFDTKGNAVEDAAGHLRVVLDAGGGGLVSASGKALTQRPDKLGSPSMPLPFNPGNSQLDAIVLQTEAGKVGFNGFLPDLTSPRLVRPVTLTGTVASVFGSELRDDTLPSPPNVLANQGAGEWAGALLTISSSGAGGSTVETKYVVSENLNENGGATAVFRIPAGESFDGSLIAPGDTYTVTRTEFFEPVPPPLPSSPAELARVTVDPENHPRDPDDPQDALNSDLRYFVRMEDESGVERTDEWDPATQTFLPVPPKTTLRLLFSEAMDAASFLPYESFYVADASLPKTDPAFRDMRIGRVSTSADGRTVRFAPILEDQVAATEQYIGFGGTPAPLRLVLRTLPEVAAVKSLKDSATPAVLSQLVDTDEYGVAGCTDLGGRGLGLPAALLDQSDPINFMLATGSAGRGAFAPAIDFAMEFETQASADADYGAVVHRFMGQASTSIFTYPAGAIHDTVTQGIEYHDYPGVDEDTDGDIDRRFIYGPTLLEVGLNIPGRLTGASAATIEHLIDNFNKPKRSSYASPNGEDFLISVGFGLGVPLNSGFGARFQHIFRAGDASPAQTTFRGAILDLVGLAWSPFNNSITNTKLDGLEVLVGLSGISRGLGPNTNQTNGIPAEDTSGLIDFMDCNKLEWLDNCQPNADIKPISTTSNEGKLLLAALDSQPPMTNLTKPGTPYLINSGALFNPANAANSTAGSNKYLDLPTFNTGIDPIFGRTDVFSFPYDSNFPMLIEYQVAPNVAVPSSLNLFRFSPGILSSALPRFRVWSQGQNPQAHCVPNWTLNVGPPPYGGNPTKWFRGGEGGPLIEPGTLSQPLPPPDQNNGMPTIQPDAYVLPPYVGNTVNQPEPDWVRGEVDEGAMSPTAGCITQFPTCNTDPYMNWYFANGMLMYPLPNLTAYPGPTGSPPTYWYGYGVPSAAVCGLLGFCPPQAVAPCIIPGSLGSSNQVNPAVLSNEPGMSSAPAVYGENSRYYMMWKYQKRVSIIESPTVLSEGGTSGVRYLRPIVDPPVADVDPAASLRIEFRAGSLLDFAVPQLESGYVDVLDPSFGSKLSGPSDDRPYVKFRASFGVAKGQTQPPSIESIVIPYEKVHP